MTFLFLEADGVPGHRRQITSVIIYICIYIIYAHELQLVDMGGEHNEEAVQQEDLCYHAHAMVQQCGTMVQQCHYSTQVEQ